MLVWSTTNTSAIFLTLVANTNLERMMTSGKDNGDWLSAQQAVQADGSERENLPLINKKLPPLVRDTEAITMVVATASTDDQPVNKAEQA